MILNECTLSERVIKNVIYYRELNNLSAKELSKLIGKKDHFIEKLEAGLYKKEPTTNTIDLLAKIFNVPTDELVKEKTI